MALRVDNETPDWRYRSWLRPLGGLAVAAGGLLVAMVVLGGLLAIDGTAHAVHLSGLQDLVATVATMAGLAVAVPAVVVAAHVGRPTVVATTADGLVVVGRRRLVLPWTMVAGVRLVPPARRAGRRRVPALALRTGAVVPLRRAASRLPARAVEALDAAGGDPGTRDLPGRRAVRVARGLETHLGRPEAATGITSPSPAGGPDPAPGGGFRTTTEVPGGATFRARARDLMPPQYRFSLYGAVVVASGRLSLSVARTQSGSGHPFDWGQFALVMVLVVTGVELLIGLALWFSAAELAVGPGWVARRRYFHHDWSVLDLPDVVSVSSRLVRNSAYARRAGLPPAARALVLQVPSGRSWLVSGRMLEGGAAAALAGQLTGDPAAFPSVARALSDTHGGVTAPAPPDPLVRARRAYRLSVATLASFLLVGALAVAVAVERRADWVALPAAVAVGTFVWLAVVRRRELRGLRQGAQPLPAPVTPTGSGAPAGAGAAAPWVARAGQAAFAATVASMALVSHGALAGGSLTIAGASGYTTYTGESGHALAAGRPWGSACEPVVFSARHLPADVYLQARTVVEEARRDGVDVAIDDNDGRWFPDELMPPGLSDAQVRFVPVFADASSSPVLGDGRPEHVDFGWDTHQSADGRHDVLSDLQATLYLKPPRRTPFAVRHATRLLVGYAEGIGNSTAPGSGLAPDGSVDGFSAGDLAAIGRMSGCAAPTGAP